MARRRRNSRNKTQDQEPGSKTRTPGKRSSDKTKKVTPRPPTKRRSSSTKPTPRPRQPRSRSRSKPKPTSGPEDYYDPLWTEAKNTVNGLDTILASREAAKRAYFRIVRLEEHDTRDGETQDAGEVGQ